MRAKRKMRTKTRKSKRKQNIEKWRDKRMNTEHGDYESFLKTLFT